MLLQSPDDLASLIAEQSIESYPAISNGYPCFAVVSEGQIIQMVSLDDFYPTPEETIAKVYVALNWHREAFDVNETEAENLEKLVRCQKFLNGELTNIAALKGQALSLKIELEHKRMRYRAKFKRDAMLDDGESATSADITARIKSEAIDTLHVSAVRNYEEMKGLWERMKSTGIAITQDRKALQYILERFMSLS